MAISYAANALGVLPLMLYGTDAQKKKYLPEVASGARLAAFAVTEATAGSDAGAIRTSARRDGAEYVIERHQAVHHQRR